MVEGAGGGIRTHKPLRAMVFETIAYPIPPRRRDVPPYSRIGGRTPPISCAALSLLLPLPAYRRGRRFLQLLVGLLLYGLSVGLLVRADLGLDPWDVFHQGLARRTGLSIGVSTIL